MIETLPVFFAVAAPVRPFAGGRGCTAGMVGHVLPGDDCPRMFGTARPQGGLWERMQQNSRTVDSPLAVGNDNRRGG